MQLSLINKVEETIHPQKCLQKKLDSCLQFFYLHQYKQNLRLSVLYVVAVGTAKNVKAPVGKGRYSPTYRHINTTSSDKRKRASQGLPAFLVLLHLSMTDWNYLLGTS